MERKRKLPSWLTEHETELSEHGGISKASEEPHTGHKANASEDRLVKSEDEEEDDYLNMTFDHNEPPRRRGIGKGSTSRNGPPRSSRKEHLSIADQKPSKAMKMMKKMGYNPGDALGSSGQGIVEPLLTSEQNARRGLGLDNQTRREVVEKAEKLAQEVDQEQSQYRTSVLTAADEKRLDGRIHAAQKICETLDTRAAETQQESQAPIIHHGSAAELTETVNILWRSLVVQRKRAEQERLLRQQMLDSALTFSGRQYNDESREPSRASVGTRLRDAVYEEEGEEQDDPELDAFESLDASVRFDAILTYLRSTHRYCFWCGCQYADEEDLKNCPGLREEDHE